MAFHLPCWSQSQTRLYVGNLSFRITEVDVKNHFIGYGTVKDVQLVVDRETGRPRGFAFVTMGTPEEADKAIDGRNGAMLDGRPLRVNLAEELRARPDKGRSGGGFGGGGGGGYGGGGRRGGRGGRGMAPSQKSQWSESDDRY
ncbi:MAG: RNA-binding protein [Saprospiraceae bacterium]|nr:RNA-binding protein [Saprospiraceae bacterium]